MDQELVVKDILTNEMISAGETLIRLLDNTDVAVSASLWLYFSEADKWRLVMASPLVMTEGPRKTYLKIRKAIDKMPAGQPTLALKDITAVDEQDRLIVSLRRAFQNGKVAVGRRFFNYPINGNYIEDAYIYRL